MNVKPWQHIVFSVGLTIVLGGLIFFVLILPALMNRQAVSQRMETLQSQYLTFTRAAASNEILQTELEQLADLKINEDGFFQDKTRSLAAADLQQLIQTLVREAGGYIISAQVLPERENENVFPEIVVNVHLRGSLEVLQQLLYSMTLSSPLLFVDNLLVQYYDGASDYDEDDGADELEVHLDVAAYIYRTEPP